MEKVVHACASFLKRAKPPRYYKYLRNGETRGYAREFSETGNTMPSSVSNLLIDNGAEDLGPSTIEAIDSDED